jgi:hypothetical protein
MKYRNVKFSFYCVYLESDQLVDTNNVCVIFEIF